MNFGIMIQLRNGRQTVVLTDTEAHAADLAEIHTSGRVPEQLTGRVAKLSDGRWYLMPTGKGSHWFPTVDKMVSFVHAL